MKWAITPTATTMSEPQSRKSTRPPPPQQEASPSLPPQQEAAAGGCVSPLCSCFPAQQDEAEWAAEEVSSWWSPPQPQDAGSAEWPPQHGDLASRLEWHSEEEGSEGEGWDFMTIDGGRVG